MLKLSTLIKHFKEQELGYLTLLQRIMVRCVVDSIHALSDSCMCTSMANAHAGIHSGLLCMTHAHMYVQSEGVMFQAV